MRNIEVLKVDELGSGVLADIMSNTKVLKDIELGNATLADVITRKLTVDEICKIALADRMFTVEGLKGTEFCNESDLVDNDEMIANGHEVIPVTGKITKGYRNYTTYYVKEGSKYVYAECLFEKVGLYTKLIISKSIFNDKGLRTKPILLETGKGSTKDRCVPSYSCGGTTLSVHKTGKGSKDHLYSSLNLILEEGIRDCSNLENCKNKLQFDTIKNLSTGDFEIKFEEDIKLLSEEDIVKLRAMGYFVKVKCSVILSKVFETKKEALKAIREYEEMFYGGFAYSILNDMRGRFDLKFQELIMQTITSEDVIKTILKEYAHDAYYVHRYNLIPLCDRYGIKYNEGRQFANGDLVT